MAYMDTASQLGAALPKKRALALDGANAQQPDSCHDRDRKMIRNLPYLETPVQVFFGCDLFQY